MPPQDPDRLAMLTEHDGVRSYGQLTTLPVRSPPGCTSASGSSRASESVSGR